MNPFAIIIGIILLTGSLFYVAAPFRSWANPVKTKKQASKNSQSLQADHQAVIIALRDLDFDYRAGKISEEDYPGIRASLLEKAALTLKDLEESSDAPAGSSNGIFHFHGFKRKQFLSSLDGLSFFHSDRNDCAWERGSHCF